MKLFYLFVKYLIDLLVKNFSNKKLLIELMIKYGLLFKHLMIFLYQQNKHLVYLEECLIIINLIKLFVYKELKNFSQVKLFK